MEKFNDGRKVAYALNLCMVSVSQIIDYNDIYVVEQEYDSILNNLNLENFVKDDELLNVMKKILDTCFLSKINEEKKQFLEKEYQQKMDNAIWSAVPNMSVFFTGGHPVQIALSALTQIGAGYMNYRRSKSDYIQGKEKAEFELQLWAKEQFHGLRLALFQAAWKLAEKYEYPDVFRLSEKQIQKYNHIVIDTNPMKRFERLIGIQSDFEAFAPFWYFKGSAARELYRDNKKEKYKEEAITAFNTFYKYNCEFMRSDLIAASCALEHISILNLSTDEAVIRKLIEYAERFAKDNFDTLQMCTQVYLSLKELTL